MEKSESGGSLHSFEILEIHARRRGDPHRRTDRGDRRRPSGLRVGPGRRPVTVFRPTRWTRPWRDSIGSWAAPIARLIIAGDLVESPRPCRRTAADLQRLRDWLHRIGVSVVVLEGNHDRSLMRVSRSRRVSITGPPLPSTCMVAGWTIGHGHLPLTGDRTISGHLHPVVRLAGTNAPCFVAGPDRIILPAFSANAAGWDILTGEIPKNWPIDTLRCFVSTGDELLDFGPISGLQRLLRLQTI